MNFSAVILAGGKSTRMGRDKAFLEVGGRTLLARQTETVRAAGAAEIFISGRDDTDYSAFGLRVLRDEFPDAGPLAGIHAALAVAQIPVLLVLAVDLPNMNSEKLRTILSSAHDAGGAIPRIGNVEPLAAFYSKTALPVCTEMLDRGFNSARGFASACVAGGLATFVDLPADDGIFFANCNAPGDVARAVATP